MSYNYPLEMGQRVEYIHEKGVYGTITHLFCEYGDHGVEVKWDDEEAASEIGLEVREDSVKPVEGHVVEDLILLAEALDKARIRANAIEATAPQAGVYGRISDALVSTLMLLIEEHDDVNEVYDSILDGNTVREALAAWRSDRLSGLRRQWGRV